MSARRTPGPRPVPQRVLWSEGAALTHRDLGDAVAYEARLLALHVAALHDTWGVALGLTLALSGDGRSVLVGPGLAYTCAGDALVLAAATPAPPFPPAVLMADLVVGAPAAGEAWPCERLRDCDGRAPRERPSLRWETAVDASDPTALFGASLARGVRLGADVPLGRFTRRPDGTLAGPALGVRRVARGLARPHLGFGALAAGALAWAGGPAEFVATVDTSAAGFTTPPRYAVWLAAGGTWPAGVVGPFASVEAAGKTSFALRATYAVRPFTPFPAGAVRAHLAAASALWVGVEDARGCPPALLLSHAFDAGPWAAALAALQGNAP
ncbi:hypothetical protein tb265_49060 [Gemmatimonadetes bacterium T265]|nr:hypothetical protein tb265_49060 [Gemmatimonadetes bacterium T265]